jgi:hypothetical protein
MSDLDASPARLWRKVCWRVIPVVSIAWLVTRLGVPLAGRLSGGQQLPAGPLGKGLHTDRVEHAERGAQLRPGVGAAALAAQPLAIQQVRTGELGTAAGAAQPVDRLAVPVLGLRAFAD